MSLLRILRTRARVVSFIVLAALSFALVTAIASAQTRKKTPTKPPRTTKPATSVTATVDAAAPLAPKTETASPRAAGASAAREDGGVVESKTLDGGARVFRFGEMEIEGRLRNPQLVYFLRRVRAEFAAGDLGHRSFMQELSETKKEPAF